MRGESGRKPEPEETPQLLYPEPELDNYLNQQLGAVHRLDHLGRALLASGGKRFRARLTLHLAKCLGVQPEAALPWAAATEMLHNASLVHDDIQDQDLWRRGKPTLWSEHGTDVAISVGDYLLMKPFLILAQIPVSEAMRYRLSQGIAEAVTQMAVAQVEERQLLNHLASPDLKDRYLAVVRGKTSSLFSLSMMGISILAEQSDRDREAACAAFSRLGRYFQAHDDLSDIRGKKGKLARGEDLREGKVSAVVIGFLALAPHRRVPLDEFLCAPTAVKAEGQVEAWLNEFHQSGAVRLTEQWVETLWNDFVAMLPENLRALNFDQTVKNWMQAEGESHE